MSSNMVRRFLFILLVLLLAGIPSADAIRVSPGTVPHAHTDSASGGSTLTGSSIVGGTVSGITIIGAAPATPTANVLYTDSVIKGWVVFDVDGAISDDLNVSSITDNGAGDWTVNWATAFASANYAIAVTAQSAAGTGGVQIGVVSATNAPTTTAARVFVTEVTSGNAGDPTGTTPRVHVIAIGD